ncbi:CHC2 zinc finger domain-containing protein [Microcystis sp. M112S1]|uniref:CHC2 zinc finger domain-containing protein n=1 Tax=Microcystis sp. M112S1 TaxID=2771103 RepID=UPI00258587D9|nr:CHC2 zinc finger domain-containing protein [Microcystis sp. M112S1]MCA2950811.1 toprim domain-containing protein [Microcystis sp. M112S1]MCA4900901.1 toprim domain-containing protein [Cytophagales bacterium]MCA6373912.1 toprim domain-containing protein [Cytophagales bacterium]MCA6386125.1 toprim domain-containing protein [Cytophagales bacterium]
MEISEIKASLTIAQVLDHYGLKPDKNHRLCCPFHDDKTPSMQVYTETNTVHCFSSNCKLHGKAVDVIDFIMHHEGITKHEAILKAKELIGYSEPSQPLEKLFKVFQSTLKKNEKAQAYLKGRSIEKAETGFNSGTWESLKQCVIFPLKNKHNKIVSLYGRSILGNEESRHFYTRNRKGLYPHWPKADTKQLILTEAIIDAATLVQNTDYSVLACYGTNGFTAEHEQAIIELKQLEEVIIFFDGDEAGKEGSKRIADKIHQLKPEIKLSSVNTPQGEDVNSLLQSHEPGILSHLVEKRSPLSFSSERKNPAPTSQQFDSSNPLKLIYRTLSANYYVKGGLRHEADSMRVSLDIEHPQNGRKSRSKVDLYEDKQVERMAREAAEKLQLRSDLIQLDLEVFTELLEQYREKSNAPKETAQTESNITLQYGKQAIDFLSKPNLIKRWNDLIGKAGVIGEENNRIFLMGIAITHKMKEPLHALIQGSSGSGKTHLMAKVYNFIPQADKKNFTRVTEGSLYNYGMYDLQNKLICIEDLDGMKEEAQFAFRELQSKGVIISSTSTKDDNGNISAQEKTVYGPIASMSCTTKGEIYEDNMSRCFIIAVDESHEQSKKVIYYQNQKASGQIDEVKEKQCTEFIQTMVTLLKSYDVINPYADKVHLPEEAHKIRRLNGLYQAFVKAVTLMHQYQRKKDNRGRLISEKEDLQIAAEILFESILLKVDELDGSLRQFYERLKLYIKTKGNGHHESYEFGQREVRQSLHVSKTQLHRYLHDLEQLEYIRQSGGYANRGFNYKVLYWDNVQAMRSKVKRHLQGQLDQLELATA